MRWLLLLLPATSSLLAGCQARTVIPFDVVIHPKVAADIHESGATQTPALPSEYVWVGAAVLLVGLWLFSRSVKRPEKCPTK